MPNWIEFEEVAARRFPDLNYVTLQPRGTFVMSQRTFEGLGSPAAVVLLYDPECETIGLRPAPIERHNAVVVRTRPGRYNKVIRSKRFVQKYKIHLDHTVQFPNAFIDDEGVLNLRLSDRIPAGHMPWKR